jgi:hypothetical protein
MVFRSLFIGAIGYFGYVFIDPEPIWDTPFSELTLNKIFTSILGILIILGCLKWFFSFPERPKNASPNFSPYEGWAKFSGYIFVIAVIAWILFVAI